MLVSLTNINKFYNGNQVLNNVSLTIDENDRIGLVGVNGCGKSTLLKIITGSVEPDRFTERDGIIAYHGYQSFASGEAPPELAHEIGLKLAKQLWGDKYQVIVATHLDKANHLHNHFVGAPIRGRVNPLSKRQA